jgi:uncharacterized protein with HEPN domain
MREKKFSGVRLHLHDILSEIAGVRNATAGLSYEAFAENWVVRRASERGLEIVSEASRKLPAEMRNLEPHIPWRQIAGVSDTLRYNYENVSNRIVWDIIVRYLDELERAVRRRLDAAEAEPRQR